MLMIHSAAKIPACRKENCTFVCSTKSVMSKNKEQVKEKKDKERRQKEVFLVERKEKERGQKEIFLVERKGKEIRQKEICLVCSAKRVVSKISEQEMTKISEQEMTKISEQEMTKISEQEMTKIREQEMTNANADRKIE
eukprot:g59332.t1